MLITPNSSRIIVGGLFTLVGGTKSPHIAALSASTGAITKWASHPKYELLSFAATSSSLYAAGGGGGGHIPKYNLSNGKLVWTASPDGDAESVSIYHNLLLVGGHFRKVGAQVRNHAAALDLQSGKVDLTWAPSFNQVLGVWPVLGYGQDAYAGGDFTRVGLVDQQGLAHFQDSVSDTTAPTLSTLPNAHMTVGSTVGSSVPVSLAWRGHDNLSGICRYRVHQQINAGAVTGIVPARPTNTSVGRAIIPGTRVYHFSVAAHRLLGQHSWIHRRQDRPDRELPEHQRRHQVQRRLEPVALARHIRRHDQQHVQEERVGQAHVHRSPGRLGGVQVGAPRQGLACTSTASW